MKKGGGGRGDEQRRGRQNVTGASASHMNR